MLGPIDYLVVGFEGNNFNGSILEELAEATESGTIRVVDLLFIIKDADGAVVIAEIEDQHEELREVVKIFNIPEGMELLTESDVEKIGETLDNDTSAGVLVIEQLWAKGLKKALIDTGGILIDEGRIHPDVVSAAVDELNGIKE